MQSGIFGHRPKRARVRRHHDVMCLCHGGYFFHLRDAAGATGVRLHHIHEFLLNQLAQSEDRAHALTRGQRNVRGIAYAPVTIKVLRRNRVFHEEQFVGFKFTRQGGSVGRCQPGWPVQIDHQVDLIAHCFTQGGNFAHRVRHAAAFECGHAACFECQRGFGCAGVRVHAYLAAHLAAQEAPHRNAQYLAFDVPQRHVNAGHGAGAYRARHAMAHDGDLHFLPEPLYMLRVFTDQQGL